jgi:hypothetical protein
MALHRSHQTQPERPPLKPEPSEPKIDKKVEPEPNHVQRMKDNPPENIPPDEVIAKIAVGILAASTNDQRMIYDGLMREFLQAKGPVKYIGVDGYEYSFAYFGADPGWQVIPLGPGDKDSDEVHAAD